MHCHCGTNNRAPRWTFTQTRGETRYPGGVSVSCLASRSGCPSENDRKPTGRKFENQWTTMTTLATKNYDYNSIAGRLRTVTTVITATKIKERHYNNVLSFPSFTTPDRENTRQRTIDGLQPSPPSPRGSSVDTTQEWYRSDPEGEENPKQTTRQPKQLTRTRQEENIVKMLLSKLLQNKRKKGPTHSPRPASPQKPKTNFTPKILHPKIQKHSNIHPPPTRNNPTPSDRQTFTKLFRQ